MVANLWDVTDRDIDRFCRALIQAWQRQAASAAGAAPHASAGQRAQQGEKAMGALRLGDEESMCVDERGKSVDGGGDTGSVHAAMHEARAACRLRFLTGAAPVCYGLPVRFV